MIPFSADPDRGLFPVLVVPWGEAADRSAERPGWRYARGGVLQPASTSGMFVNLDHDGTELVGAIVATSSDSRGLWALARFGRTGLDWLARGCRAVSAEVDRDDVLCGVALVTTGRPGFRSARVFVAGEAPKSPTARAISQTSRVRSDRRDDELAGIMPGRRFEVRGAA